MQGIEFQIYCQGKDKYKKFESRLEKSIASGRFFKVSRRHQNRLIQRVEKFRARLDNLQSKFKIGVAASLVVTALAASAPEVKAQGLGPFTNVNRVLNPLRPPIYITSQYNVGPSFSDIDGDGDLDLLVSTPEGSGDEILTFNPTWPYRS